MPFNGVVQIAREHVVLFVEGTQVSQPVVGEERLRHASGGPPVAVAERLTERDAVRKDGCRTDEPFRTRRRGLRGLRLFDRVLYEAG